MTPTTICSFWVHRPEDFPDAADYLGMLGILDASCRRFGMRHVVLTDEASSRMLPDGMEFFARPLPRNLLQATTEAQARWVEEWPHLGADTVFVGADCLIIRDFRPHLPPADLSIILFKHKRLWIMNGFIHVPAGMREAVAPLFREVADDTQPLDARTCDDMMAWERALKPKPGHYGPWRRRGLMVNFLDEPTWNGRPASAAEACTESYVLHFRGGDRKPVFFDWAKAHGFA